MNANNPFRLSYASVGSSFEIIERCVTKLEVLKLQKIHIPPFMVKWMFGDKDIFSNLYVLKMTLY
jgi:hypothetical protein